MTNCPKSECNNPNSQSYEYAFDKFPDKTKEMLKNKSWANNSFKQCGYCDAVWTEVYAGFELTKYVIGDRGVGDGKMDWHDNPTRIKCS